jgi:hypothetical protein
MKKETVTIDLHEIEPVKVQKPTLEFLNEPRLKRHNF